MEYAIAVFDVGKTNKKLLIYDNQLKLIDTVSQRFPAVQQNGVSAEPVVEIERWLLQNLKQFAAQYPIRVISVSTHGAAFVCVDPDGNPTVPALDYTHDPGDDFHDTFFQAFGSRIELQQQTATAELKPLINPGKAIYYLQQKFPDDFARTASVLFFPEFFGFRLTGQKAADFTYPGCHTFLWDFAKDSWSAVADGLGIRDLVPQRVGSPWEVLGTLRPEVLTQTGLDPSTIVTLGIHDSNASLLPYLLKMEEDFVLNSTGTWCVAMHPMEQVFFSDDELGKTVFYNRSAFGTPVKTSILMGGQEFEVYTKLLLEMNNADSYPEFNNALYQRVIRDKSLFIFPSVVRGTGQFPDSEPRVFEGGRFYALEDIGSGRAVPQFFNDLPVALAVLNLSLVIQTGVALERIGHSEGTAIYIEGGFRNNLDYNTILAAYRPQSPVYLSDLKEATSFGAAMVGRTAWEGIDVRDLTDTFEIHTQRIRPAALEGLEEYAQQFMKLL
ncbi:MAG: carbohydrate kinase [Spirochaetaceae bacterium]|nr:MAG: carbohydrate kinase [Spirochaetaceae bacterium]